MTPQRIVHACLLGFFVIAILYVREKWHTEAWQANPMYTLVSIIVLAVIAGVVFVLVILPMLGDAVTTAVLSSGEEVTQDEGLQAAAKLAAGDYEGAIEEYHKALSEKPDDSHAISEIAKIYSDKLGATDQALAFLQEQLEGREWTPDDAAFLMFRMVDVNLHAEDYDAAKDILDQVAINFPDTRHSANARHRITEIEQLQYKARRAQEAAQLAQQNPNDNPA